MKLASLKGRPDGTLAVVSSDASRYAVAEGIAATMQEAIDRWDRAEPQLRQLSAALEAGGGNPVESADFSAPLPRAWQWLDGSAFPSHGALMDQVLGIVPEKSGRPLMYQGVSDRFLGATEDVPLPSEADGIDFEGEFGVITSEVPMGVSAETALDHVRLIVQINDWSLRALAGDEMKTGFGWVQAKPVCSMAPFAVTPDELGNVWRAGQVHLRLHVFREGEPFGAAHGGAMEFNFGQLIAHAARTRHLSAGTIIGSGTVSNSDFRTVGSSCIAERRGIEILDEGQASTPFLRFGERVRMEARLETGGVLFGAIDQCAVEYRP